MYFVGVDVGTSSTKAVVFDASGSALGSGTSRYEVDRNGRGYAEQDPTNWWAAAAASLQTAIGESGVSPNAIAGVGLSGQMHGMVALDARGEIVRPAILHSDVRSKQEAAEIKEILGGEIERITRNPVFSGFQAVSLFWLAKHEPESLRRTQQVVCPKDYVRYRLTGKLAAEHTDASGTLLYDLESEKWSNTVLDGLGLARGIVPSEIGQPYEVAGRVTAEAAAATGLAAGTPVAYGGADQAMHSVGNGVFSEDAAMATTGSSGQVMLVSRRLPATSGQPIHTFRHVSPGHVYGLAGVLSAGNAMTWYRSQLLGDTPFDDLNNWAAQVPAGSDGLVFLPCLAGERTPYLDPDARAVFVGISALHDRRHFTRSVMEGVSFAMKTGFDVLSAVYGSRDRLVCAGGATRASTWRQIQADIFGRAMSISRVSEQGCLGAAIMAAIASGTFRDLQAACTNMCDQEMTVVHPRKETSGIYNALYERVYSRIYDNNAQAFSVLAELHHRSTADSWR